MLSRLNKRHFYGLILSVILIALDQITKQVAVRYLDSQPSFSLIPHILELDYTENTGIAWGMMSGGRILIIIMTVLMILGLIWFYLLIPSEQHFSLMRILTAVLISGAIGNLIDRIVRGFVVDFIYFSLIDFPVFNIADCFITVSLPLILLIYRKEVAEWMKNG